MEVVSKTVEGHSMGNMRKEGSDGSIGKENSKRDYRNDKGQHGDFYHFYKNFA